MVWPLKVTVALLRVPVPFSLVALLAVEVGRGGRAGDGELDGHRVGVCDAGSDRLVVDDEAARGIGIDVGVARDGDAVRTIVTPAPKFGVSLRS